MNDKLKHQKVVTSNLETVTKVPVITYIERLECFLQNKGLWAIMVMPVLLGYAFSLGQFPHFH